MCVWVCVFVFSTDLAPGVSPCVGPAGGGGGGGGLGWGCVIVLKPVLLPFTLARPHTHQKEADVGQCKKNQRVAEIPIPQYPLRPL